MDALEKLDAVQVQPDSRISDKDRRYCETHQKAYQEAKNLLSELECVWKDMTERQKTILAEVESDSYQMNPYVSIEGLSAEKIHERADTLHGIFIRKLVGYFERTYRVTLQADDIIRILLPDRPESKAYRSNAEAWREYHRQLDVLLLDYRNVLDQIFAQLGSRTFLERALDELKGKCHVAAWNTYHGKADFERKNDTIIWAIALIWWGRKAISGAIPENVICSPLYSRGLIERRKTNGEKAYNNRGGNF